MKKITLSIDEEVLKAARAYAAAHETTVTALVREFLEGFRGGRAKPTEAERVRIREALFRLSESSPGRLGDWKWNREDVYRERLSRCGLNAVRPGSNKERTSE